MTVLLKIHPGPIKSQVDENNTVPVELSEFIMIKPDELKLMNFNYCEDGDTFEKFFDLNFLCTAENYDDSTGEKSLYLVLEIIREIYLQPQKMVCFEKQGCISHR